MCFSMTMTAEGRTDVFLSCFKCGRIVRSGDTECPRCGLQFGPGTLFECPFCCGLVWRNATTCSTCGIDLTKFSEGVEKTSAGFDMDQFVDTIITTEVEQMKSTVRRVSCPGCGLMIRGDETKCPRCDLPLEEAQVDCPVCGEQIPISSQSCPRCGAAFAETESPASCEVVEEPEPEPEEPEPEPEEPEPEQEELEFVQLELHPSVSRRKGAAKVSKKAPSRRAKADKNAKTPAKPKSKKRR
jgi:hypothetical protein